MIDHCISAFKDKLKIRSYQNYMADCLRLLTENTAILATSMSGTQGSYVKDKYSDMEKKASQPPKKQRKAEEIIATIKYKLEHLDDKKGGEQKE